MIKKLILGLVVLALIVFVVISLTKKNEPFVNYPMLNKYPPQKIPDMCAGGCDDRYIQLPIVDSPPSCHPGYFMKKTEGRAQGEYKHLFENDRFDSTFPSISDLPSDRSRGAANVTSLTPVRFDNAIMPPLVANKLPHESLMGAPTDPMKYANMIEEINVKENFKMPEYANIEDLKPNKTMYDYDKEQEVFVGMPALALMTSTVKSRGYAGGDQIRGDLAVTPCHRGYFDTSQSFNPESVLNRGALRAMGGDDLQEMKRQYTLIDPIMGGTMPALGGYRVDHIGEVKRKSAEPHVYGPDRDSRVDKMTGEVSGSQWY